MRRYHTLLFIGLVLVLSSAMVSADTLEDIDRTVEQLGEFLTGIIPDREGQNLTILPFLSDRHGKVTLGDRLKSELELYLAAEYRNTRIVQQPQGANTYTVTGELQSYSRKVRVICRITKPDGSLGGGTRVDIPSTPQLLGLLEPSLIEQTEPGVRSEPLGGGPLATASEPLEDPFEPDEAEGFEVQLQSSGRQSLARYITPGDIDRFRFYKSAEGTVVLETQTNSDLQLLLYREGENIPFEVSGERRARSLRLETSLGEGYYIVELLAYDFDVQGSYIFTIDLTGRSNDSFEPDNSLAQSKSIFPGSTQDRALLSADQDWVELSFTLPGFYAVYTTGLQADTVISLFTENEREILRNDDSGRQNNAYIPLFLGIRRIYARISGKSAADGGTYTLGFEKIEPTQIYPGAGIEQFNIEETPRLAQLRILQTGNYLIHKQEKDAVTITVYNLPEMRALEGRDSLYWLAAGDYLLIVESKQPGSVRFCIAPEDQTENCLRSLKE